MFETGFVASFEISILVDLGSGEGYFFVLQAAILPFHFLVLIPQPMVLLFVVFESVEFCFEFGEEEVFLFGLDGVGGAVVLGGVGFFVGVEVPLLHYY